MTKKFWLFIFCSMLLLGITGVCMAFNQPGPPAGPKNNMEMQLKNGLDHLVSDQVITPKQAQFLLKYFHDAWANDFNRPINYRNLLDELIKSGDITPNQAKAIERILPTPHPPIQ